MNQVKIESMPSEPHGKNRVRRKCLSLSRCLLLVFPLLTTSFAQESSPKEQSTLDVQSLSDRLAISTDSVEPIRFVAVHGRRAVIMGYPETGLESWVYPFQIFSDYQIVTLLAQRNEAKSIGLRRNPNRDTRCRTAIGHRFRNLLCRVS